MYFSSMSIFFIKKFHPTFPIGFESFRSLFQTDLAWNPFCWYKHVYLINTLVTMRLWSPCNLFYHDILHAYPPFKASLYDIYLRFSLSQNYLPIVP